MNAFLFAMNKEAFIQHLLQIQQEKVDIINMNIVQLRNDLLNNTKSSVGDKHETSRSMIQLEMEKLGQQGLEAEKILKSILQIKSTSTKEVQSGSLIQLNNEYFFVGVGLGKINFMEQSVFCLSMMSPLGKHLLGKQMNDSISFNQKTMTINSIQ